MDKQSNKSVIIFWIVFISIHFLFGVFLLRRDAGEGFGSLAYGGVPYFEMTNQRDKAINLHMLKGKVWLVHFLSEYDNKVYPQVYDIMKALDDKYASQANFELVSFVPNIEKIEGVDINDEYNRWSFLKGDKQDILNLMQSSFYINNQTDTFSSGLKLFLIDQNATIRGYYTISDQDDIKQIEKNLINLL